MVSTTPARPLDAAPPPEQFWRRYSPHGEAGLSAAGSFVVHAAVLGTVVLFAAYLGSLFFKPNRSLPIDTVRYPAGPGQPGPGDGKGLGVPVEDVPRGDRDQAGVRDPAAPARPALDPVEVGKVRKSFDPDDTKRILARSNSDHVRAFVRLDEGTRAKLRGKDAVSPGKPGAAPGPGTGPGGGKLTQREKRMLRWHMRFTANTGAQYVEQLAGLGAILAVPTNERGAAAEYRVIRDLAKKPAKLEKEDLAKIERIYWIDDKEKSVRDVMAALGLKIRPSRFVAFMPKKLEDALFRMERDHVEKVLKKTFDEDRIAETTFRVVPRGRGFEPVLQEVRMKD